MKKTAISIFTCFCMLIGMLSFSIPSSAGYVQKVYQQYTQPSDSTVTLNGLNVSTAAYHSQTSGNGVDFVNLTGQITFNGRFGDFDIVPDLPFSSYDAFSLRGLVKLVPSFKNTTTTSGIFPGRANIVVAQAYINFGGHSYALNRLNDTDYFIINVSGECYPVAFYGTAVSFTVICDFSIENYASSENIFQVVLSQSSLNMSTCYHDQTWGSSYEWYLYSSTRVNSSDLEKQTDTLTNGYDNSSMSDDNTRLNDQIAQYDKAQESATNTSVSNIDAADFINPSSNASVFAAMTFSASFLQSLYNNLGDFGIVVMVSLSLCLGLMLVGWFKYRKGG